MPARLSSQLLERERFEELAEQRSIRRERCGIHPEQRSGLQFMCAMCIATLSAM
jgi:hypothetical protein